MRQSDIDVQTHAYLVQSKKFRHLKKKVSREGYKHFSRKANE